jgi:hypothetical protein
MACITAYKEPVSNNCSRELTACFTSASVANRLPVICFLRSPKRCKSLCPTLAIGLVTGYGPPFLQSRSHALWWWIFRLHETWGFAELPLEWLNPCCTYVMLCRWLCIADVSKDCNSLVYRVKQFKTNHCLTPKVKALSCAPSGKAAYPTRL